MRGSSRSASKTLKSPTVVLTSEAERPRASSPVPRSAASARRAADAVERGSGTASTCFSLLPNCGFPCLVLVTMRGEFADFQSLAGADGLDHRAGFSSCAAFSPTGSSMRRTSTPWVASGCDMAL